MSKKDNIIQIVNLEETIKNGNSKILKFLPGAVVSILKWMICQKKINRQYTRIAHYQKVDFFKALLSELNIKVTTSGLESIEIGPRYTFVSNHPFGAIDGAAMSSTINDQFGEMRVIANELLLTFPNLKGIVIPVNVFSPNTREAIKLVNETYESDFPVFTFPAGEVSRKVRGVLTESAWQKSFIQKSIETKRNIVPCYIHGENSRFFYFIHWLRKNLGISLNIELLRLPAEMLNKKNKNIQISFGTPISYQMFDSSRSHVEWAQWVKKLSDDLRNNHDKI